MPTVLSTNAIATLEADHREAEALFKKYEKLRNSNRSTEKYGIANQVCAALLAHMEMEEKLFYPAARTATGLDDKLNEAQIEHAAARDLITQIGKLHANDPLFDAKVKVLSEQMQHHINEEEHTLFPLVRSSSLDLEQLGASMQQERENLQASVARNIHAEHVCRAAG
ncbi:hemerythrin domain-containing protein [Undibacterium terreum]|uniref:Hemerythrin n=1 Tax=Undibacterium terreum TaxID=1224302 RepID=A0A916U9P6_9BURK|nr:hemerythrin domain-containing protein [Undibacterium terreum]GGC64285.1 hemerythrin [Undibacterium terreum]